MERSDNKFNFWTSRIILYTILILFGAVMIFPLIYMMIASLKSSQDYQANARRLLPYTEETGTFNDQTAGIYEFKVDGTTQQYYETVISAARNEVNKVRFGYFATPANVAEVLRTYEHVPARIAFETVVELPLTGLDATGEEYDLRDAETIVLENREQPIERGVNVGGRTRNYVYQTYIMRLPDSDDPLQTYLDSGQDDENRNAIMRDEPVLLVGYSLDGYADGATNLQLVKLGERDFTDASGNTRAYEVYQVTYPDGKTEELVLYFSNRVSVFVGTEDSSQVVYATAEFSKQAEFVEFRFENYEKLLEVEKFDRALVNTVFVTILVVLGQLGTSILGGYAFSRIQFKGRDAIFMFYLGSIMIPFVVLIVPMYRLMVEIGWQSRIVSLIVPWIFTAYGTFLMRQFFQSIPIEIEEAALLDGCSRFRILWQIFVPLSTPAIATQAIFTFLYAWNSFLWPLFMFGDRPSDSRVLTLALISLANRASSGEPNLVFTGAAVTILPPVIIFILAQKYFVEGIATSGLKG